MQLIIGAFVLIVLALAAVRMRKPAAAGSGGVSVESAQAAIGRNRTERFVIIDRLMKRRGGGKIARNLVTAGLMLKPAEFMMVNLFSFAITLVLGSFLLRRMPVDSFASTMKFFGAAAVIFYL